MLFRALLRAHLHCKKGRMLSQVSYIFRIRKDTTRNIEQTFQRSFKIVLSGDFNETVHKYSTVLYSKKIAAKTMPKIFEARPNMANKHHQVPR